MAFPAGDASPPPLSPHPLTVRTRPVSLSDRSELSAIEIPTTIPTTYQATDPSPPTTPTTNDHPLARRGSVFSFSRLSFSALLTRLTSLHLPLTEELEQRIRAASTAAEMAAALMAAGKQISAWIETAAKVLRGLDAEDDVEWAAQGKESLASVDAAVTGFEALMTVYIELIDELHLRPDAETVPSEKLVELVGSMESTVGGWREVQRLLRDVKAQVETAMEWQELWESILRDIQAELEACQTLVFELEEKRHRGGEDEDGIDIDALETIMEDRAPKSAEQIEDSSLLVLFARMQPLRASLDFLPMRLSSFVGRAKEVFPTACEELEGRRKQMEKKWTRLSADAEGLKKELGEDRWVAIFRNAGKQAGAMLESIERSMNKLRESVIVWDETNGANDKDLRKKMESYEAKKMHYGMPRSSLCSSSVADMFRCCYRTHPFHHRQRPLRPLHPQRLYPPPLAHPPHPPPQPPIRPRRRRPNPHRPPPQPAATPRLHLLPHLNRPPHAWLLPRLIRARKALTPPPDPKPPLLCARTELYPSQPICTEWLLPAGRHPAQRNAAEPILPATTSQLVLALPPPTIHPPHHQRRKHATSLIPQQPPTLERQHKNRTPAAPYRPRTRHPLPHNPPLSNPHANVTPHPLPACPQTHSSEQRQSSARELHG